MELLESLLYVFVDMEIQPAGHSTRPLHPSAVVALALGWPGHTAVDQVLCPHCASAKPHSPEEPILPGSLS